MSIRCSQSHYDILSISRCKRILRPFTSKISYLNQLHAKSPSLFEFKFNETIDEKIETSNHYKRRKLHDSSYKSSSRPGSKDGSKSAFVVKSNIILVDSGDDDNESDNDFTFHEETSPTKPIEKPNFMALVDPGSSEERMMALKPYISSEVYQHYFDLFQLFKNLLLFLCGIQDHSSVESRVPKLSSLASMKVGKLITMNTKSTYYKLNQSILFDIKTLPKNLQTYHERLSDDIDDWLSMEPKMLSDIYRRDFVLGYILNLLTFNSHSLLFCLIPVLVHWLHEQVLINEHNHTKTKFNMMKDLLFAEYSNYSYSYFEGIDIELICELDGKWDIYYSHEIFWLYHKIGYWNSLVNLLNPASDSPKNLYSDWFLNSLSFDERLRFDITSHIERKYFQNEGVLTEAYKFILQNPFHPQNNKTLVNIVSQLMACTRIELESSHSHETLNPRIKLAQNKLASFMHCWLSPSIEGPILFDPFFGCNNLIFQGLLQTCKFLLNKGYGIAKRTNPLLEDKMEGSLTQLFSSLEECMTFYESIKILNRYLIGSPHTPQYNSHILKSLARCVVRLFTYGHNDDVEFRVFLNWLVRGSNKYEIALAQRCFTVFYGRQPNNTDFRLPLI